DAENFRLGCTPISNVFKHAADPIELKAGRFEYPLTLDATQPHAFELYSVEHVACTSPGETAAREVPPFHSIRHPRDLERAMVFWNMPRAPSRRDKDRGSDATLQFVDLGAGPHLPEGTLLDVSVLCTNRDLPLQLRAAGDPIALELEAAAPLMQSPRLLS